MKAIKITAIVLAIFATGAASAQSYKVDVTKSELKWDAKKVTGEHNGTIALKEGALEVKENKITSGSFVIDMNTIVNLDMTDAGYNAKLVGHLKSDDFFGVETYPTATLNIVKADKFSNGKAKVNADLTIKGITNPIEFEVTQADNIFKATLTVNRSKYNVKYGSASFFDNLGDKVIYDDFTLEVTLVTKK